MRAPGEIDREATEARGTAEATAGARRQRQPHAPQHVAAGNDGDAWPLLLLLLLGLVRRLPRRERFDDVVHTFGLEDDLRAVASRLVCELCAELIDVHILYAPDSSVSVSRPHERQR